MSHKKIIISINTALKIWNNIQFLQQQQSSTTGYFARKIKPDDSKRKLIDKYENYELIKILLETESIFSRVKKRNYS